MNFQHEHYNTYASQAADANHGLGAPTQMLNARDQDLQGVQDPSFIGEYHLHQAPLASQQLFLAPAVDKSPKYMSFTAALAADPHNFSWTKVPPVPAEQGVYIHCVPCRICRTYRCPI
jgi:hypothetical protein